MSKWIKRIIIVVLLAVFLYSAWSVANILLEYRKNDKIYLNEFNTIPGSLAFYLFEAAGMSYKEMLTRMLTLALDRARREQSITYSFDSNILNSASLSGSKGSKGSKGGKR